MTLEKRVEELEMSLLHTRQAINEINCAIDELSLSVRQQLVVDDMAAQKQTAFDSNASAILDNATQNSLSNTRYFQR